MVNKVVRLSAVRLLVLLVVSSLCISGLADIRTAYADNRICFPEASPVIRDCVEGRFAQFWRENGGLNVFGYPITAARMEHNADTGETYLTQYFERQRLELHPQNNRPYDVLLGRLGAEWLASQPPSFNKGDAGDPGLPHFVPETGYNIGFRPTRVNPEGGWYWEYYASHGLEFDGKNGTSANESLALLGYPITAPILRMSNETSYQVFERTILRYQGPQYAHDSQWRVVGDRIGVWYYKFVLNADTENRLTYP